DVDGPGRSSDRPDGLDDAAPLVVARGAEHDHAGAEDELRVRDRAVVARNDEVALEAERLAEPFDHAAGIVVAHGRDHRGFRGLRLLSHRESSVGMMSPLLLLLAAAVLEKMLPPGSP